MVIWSQLVKQLAKWRACGKNENRSYIEFPTGWTGHTLFIDSLMFLPCSTFVVNFHSATPPVPDTRFISLLETRRRAELPIVFILVSPSSPPRLEVEAL